MSEDISRDICLLLFRFLPENNLTDERLIPESFKQFKWLLLICNWTSTMIGRMLCVNWSSCLYWIKLQRGLVHVSWFMMTNVQNIESVIFYHNPSGPVGNFLGKERVRVPYDADTDEFLNSYVKKITEFCGFKSEAIKRGLGSHIYASGYNAKWTSSKSHRQKLRYCKQLA